MFKYIFQFTIIIMLNTALAFEVQNVVATQSTDGEHVLTVSYDLTGDDVFVSFETHSEISIDGGETWEYLLTPPIPNVLGDNVLPGTGKTFQIDLDDYFSNLYTNNALVQIEAIGHEALTLPSFIQEALVIVPAGEYMLEFTNEGPLDNQLANIDYSFEITKYYITYSQYAAFLIELYNEGIVSNGVGCGDCCVNGPSDGFGPLEPRACSDWGNVSECQSGYGYINTTGYWGTRKLHFNGTTYVVDEGWGDHPVRDVSIIGAIEFARHYGMRIPDMYEITKARRGMSDLNYAWGDDYNEEDAIKRMNYRDFPNPWHDAEAWGLNDASTPVGYFNGTTYQYPEGIEWENPDFETIYEQITENTVSPYGLYDINGNVADLTTNFEQIPNHMYAIGSNYVSYSNSTYTSWRSWIEWGGHHMTGFRLARTINNSQ